MMTPEQLTTMFTGPEGYRFARWTRPIVPVAFGISDDSLVVVKQAIEATVFAAGHRMAETDPELGANLMMFFLRDWSELMSLPDLDRMLPELPGQLVRLQEAGATQYRGFRFEPDGGIKATFVFLRMADGQEAQPAAELGLEQAVKAMLTWGPKAFNEMSPLVRPEGETDAVLRPEIAALLAAAYDPVMPASALDASHALRLAARLSQAGAGLH